MTFAGNKRSNIAPTITQKPVNSTSDATNVSAAIPMVAAIPSSNRREINAVANPARHAGMPRARNVPTLYVVPNPAGMSIAQRVRTAVAARCDARQPCMSFSLPNAGSLPNGQGDSAWMPNSAAVRCCAASRLACTRATEPSFSNLSLNARYRGCRLYSSKALRASVMVAAEAWV